MKFEKVILVEFDTAQERQRINTVFKGRKKARLLKLLDRFEKAEFEALAQERPEWEREFAECVHPVIESTLSALAERSMARSQWPGGFGEGLSKHGLTLLDLQGTPVSPAGLDYPRFKQLPTDEREFVNPNDVQEHHGYALHVLLSLAHGFLKTQEVLQQNADGNPQLQQHLADSRALVESARRLHAQLFG